MKKYNRLPLKKLGITGSWEEHVNRGSRGQDFGWFDYQGEPIYSINDGTVMEINKNSSAGNYIWIKHEFANNDMWSRYLHIKDGTTKVKVGQKVTRGQEIANMGNTGNSTGTHLHLEIWVVPKGWKFNFNDRSKYSKPSTDNAFAFDDQHIGTSPNNKVITRVIGTSKQAKRDTTKNQIEVVGEFLRARTGAGLDKQILGFIDYGIYDYIEKIEKDNYTWYNLGFCYVAGTKEDTKIYTAESPEDGKDKKIAELEEQVKKLDTELLVQKTLVEKQKEEIDQLNDKLSNYANLKEHNVDKTEYIKLINGDRIYF